MNDCTSLTSLPKGLKIEGDLWLRGCTGLTGLPFDLIVGNFWIKHYNTLTPFFKKLGIPVNRNGDTDAEDWRKWQRAHGYLKEAFKAGNRVRKKESVQDIIEGVDIQITKKTCTETVEKLAKSGKFGKIGINDLLVHVMSDTAAEIGGFDEVELFTAMQGHGFWAETTLWTEIKSDTGWFPDLCIADHGEGDGEPGGICYTWCLLSNKRTPGEPVAWHRITPHSRWIIYDRFVDIIKDIVVRARMENIPVAVGEAFKAGNRARKKETAQDAVGIFDNLLITPDRVRDYIGTAIQSVEKMCTNGSWRELINRLLSEVFEKPHINVDTYTKHENGVSISTYYYTGRESHIMVSGNNGYVMRLRIDGEGHPDKFTVGITFYDRGVRCLRGRGGDKEYETVLERDNWRRNDGYEFNDGGLLMFCQFLSTGVVPAGFAVEDVILDEAFKAGNRARKKETAQDAVESVDSIQAQIDLFEKQTGKKLEIRNGRPYFDGDLDLSGCTGLASLPTGLTVRGYLDMEGCTGLTFLPQGLTVRGLNLEDCIELTRLSDGIKVGENLYMPNCGLTSLPFDMIIRGAWIEHKGVLTLFFKKLGIPVDEDGDTNAKDWRKWQKAHRYLTEAFKAGNRARKKEAMQDAAAVTDSVNLSFMDTIGEIESFLCRRGEQEDRVMTAEGNAIDSGKWFDWRGRTEDYQALVIEVENIDGDTCNVYVYVDAAGVPSMFDATCQHRMDFECTRSLSSKAILNNVFSIFDRLAGPGGEDELPEDLRENDENWELYENLIRKHADFLQPFLCRQDLDRLIVDGVVNEAFKAGNRARRKESAQDTVESADRSVTFDEALGEIERLIHRIGSKYKRNPHNNLYSKQRPEAQAEIFHIHPFSSNELTDNDVSRDGFYPGGWPEKVTHSYDAVVDLAYFPELDRTFVMMCVNVCTIDPNDIRHMSVFNSAGSYSEYCMGNYTDKDSLRDIDNYDLMGSEFFYPVDTVSDLGKILEIVTYMLTDKRWLACMALFTVCRSFSSQYTRGLLPGAICPYIRKDLRINPEALHSVVNGALWNELLIKTNGLCGAIVDGQFTYKEILSMFEPAEYRSESGQSKVIW